VTLLACGAKLSDDGETASGGIYLVDLDSREEAEHFIESDPFHQAGLFAEVKIVRWRQAYLNRKNTL
ncbi:YciI family protein, partial [Pantoea sp. SIMBA_133]